MADTYNYAYADSRASVETDSPQYMNKIHRMVATDNNAYDNSGTSAAVEPQYFDMCDPNKYEIPKQVNAVSADIPITSNTVQNSPLKNSSNMCRLFLIIVATFVIGCVVGGVAIHLLTRQNLNDSLEDSGNLQDCAENTDVTATIGQFMCPTCPVAPTCTDTIDTSTDTVDTSLPKDCQEVKARGNMASGQYMISPQNSDESVLVYCDMDTDGGGWTVFQRREDGAVDFFLTWIDYVNGFGNVNSEHWLGNTKIHHITAQGHYELRVDMADFEGNTAYAKYDSFRIGNAGTQYKLILGSYSGDAGDSLRRQENQAFSTKDRDNDILGGGSCAIQKKGAWWYANCHDSNLTGLYLGGPHDVDGIGINWRTWKGHFYSLKHVEMKLRMAP